MEAHSHHSVGEAEDHTERWLMLAFPSLVMGVQGLHPALRWRPLVRILASFPLVGCRRVVRGSGRRGSVHPTVEGARLLSPWPHFFLGDSGHISPPSWALGFPSGNWGQTVARSISS